MKKILILFAFVLVVFGVVACDKTTTTTTTAATTTEAGTTQSTTSKDPVKEIVLSYADWGDPELNQVLIDAFEAAYPNITVELRQDITGSGAEFTGNLLNAQAAGVLPDVFAIDNVPTGYVNGMLLDISEYWDNDPETDLVYPNIAETGVYNGKRYAVPSFQFIKGIYINLNIFTTYNIPVPDKNWDYNEFVAIARQIRQVGKNDYIYGIDPWYGSLDFETTFPMQDFADVGYNTWDGTRFNFTSQAWIDAYNLKLDLMEENVVAAFTEEEMNIIGADIWPWYEGYIGMKIDGSWNLWMVENMFADNNIEVGFWPYPGGAAGQFPPTILDYQVVSSQTENPEEAYLLAKWMTFGREGWMARIGAMKERGDLYLDRFPVSDIPEVWEEIEYFTYLIEGLAENVALLPYGKPDTDKWLPGYKQFWEWVGNEENDYWTRINEGLVTPEVFASEWEAQINMMVTQALQEEQE
ncbi:MAG: extracellular solute-binding protein [Candidatus Izemoplasmatales bacterium]|nr:extracellular solute-binding protein [Candidatus Izemoplasmatales bacterium]